MLGDRRCARDGHREGRVEGHALAGLANEGRAHCSAPRKSGIARRTSDENPSPIAVAVSDADAVVDIGALRFAETLFVVELFVVPPPPPKNEGSDTPEASADTSRIPEINPSIPSVILKMTISIVVSAAMN